jgi:phosphoribosylanthranilate isomerase
MVRVKICGITNVEDAEMAVELGADALGFIFAPSPRQITLEKARDIIFALPPFVKSVGVFVDEDPDNMRRIIEFCGLDLVQLHGDEPPNVCQELMPHTIKAFRVKDGSSLLATGLYRGRIRAILFDAFSKGKYGGTGKTFDWDLVSKGRELGVPVILSGGLGPYNIEGAILTVKPYAVDVNSGIEERPGKKSPVLMKMVMEKVRRIRLENGKCLAL